jgi:hypothetical protein
MPNSDCALVEKNCAGCSLHGFDLLLSRQVTERHDLEEKKALEAGYQDQ